MKNKSFNRLFGLLVRVLPVMHKKIHRDVFKAAIEKSTENIAPHHLMILKLFRDGKDLSISEMCEIVAISQSQMAHSTNKLLALGLIAKERDARDRRKIAIELTQKGEAYLKEMDQAMRNRLTAKLSMLTEKDMDRFMESLQEVAEIFDKLHWE